jgi:hypothetical protein
VHADIGTAVDRHHAIAVAAMPRFDELQGELDFDRVVGGRFERLVADADPGVPAHAVVEAVDDHGAVIGGGEHESELASDIAHAKSPGGGTQNGERPMCPAWLGVPLIAGTGLWSGAFALRMSSVGGKP